MFLTVSAGTRRDARARRGRPRAWICATALQALARGALLGARGNSGVILSEMLGAVAGRIAAATPDERNARVMAEALRRPTEAAYAAVGAPVEGTILTVAAGRLRRGGGAAPRIPSARARDVFTAAAAAAREALARTPEQLARAARRRRRRRRRARAVRDPRRRRDGADRAPAAAGDGHRSAPIPIPTPAARPGGPHRRRAGLRGDVPPRRRRRRHPRAAPGAGRLGDSLVVVGGDGLWNVHVHVDDVGAGDRGRHRGGAPPPGAGRPTSPSRSPPRGAKTQRENRGRAVVAVAAGPGLATLFAEAGATVVRGGPGDRPSTGDVPRRDRGVGRLRGGAAAQRRRLGARGRRSRPARPSRTTTCGSR